MYFYMERKKRLSIWDVLAWVAIVSIVVWAILKISGIINSPLFIEYYPIFAASYAFGGKNFAFFNHRQNSKKAKIFWQMHKIQIISNEIKDLKKFKNETVSQINGLKLNCVKNHTQQNDK